ncbi:hypothetical protein RvY_04449 [Ramazzottius varieornatus]|uniref:Uncharacterized protein n=1 Tax=Ramazzottius varieornatus TaxID=947166 RepID=A0A1D1V1M2_RAMVA|nr:hypothetical protein RvY_04449 [Ramazzottius varieornatus]
MEMRLMVVGRRFEHTDENFIRLTGLIAKNAKLTATPFRSKPSPFFDMARFCRPRKVWTNSK